MPTLNLTGITANMETPQTYFHQIIGYVPDALDTMTERLNTPIVKIMVIIVIIVRFLRNLLQK